MPPQQFKDEPTPAEAQIHQAPPYPLPVQPVAPTLGTPATATADANEERSHLLQVAGQHMSRTPLDHLCLTELAQAGEVSEEQLRQHFASVQELGAAALDHERAQMAAIQAHVRRSGHGPLEQILMAFKLVGESLQRDVVMRAGVRLAYESRHFFPDRRLEPRRTWEGFLGEQLQRAGVQGLLRTDVDVEAEVYAAFTRALDVRDRIVREQTWSSAAAQLEQEAHRCLDRIRTTPSTAAAPQGDQR